MYADLTIIALFQFLFLRYLRDELKDFISSIGGNVKYILSPSSAHNIYIGNNVETYPNAKLICSDIAADKSSILSDTKYIACFKSDS